MSHVARRTEAGQPSPAPDDLIEFGNGLRARLESTGMIGSGEALAVRLALERKLLAALPELAGSRAGSVSRLRVPHIPLATLVYQAGLLPAEPLEAALAEAERRQEPVGRVLTWSGLLSLREVERLLAEQRGLAYVRVRDLDLDERLAAVLPERTASLFNALPLGYLEGAPVVAVSDPTDDVALESITAQVGEPVRFVAAPREEIAVAIPRLYRASEAAA
jgi:hypothetical protein